MTAHTAPRLSERFRAPLLELLFRWDTGPFMWSIMAAISCYVVILLSWAVSRFHLLPELKLLH